MPNTLKRTPSEINARISQIGDGDFFGWETGDLLSALSYDDVHHSVKDKVTREDWDKEPPETDPVAKVKDYLPFAWDKANNCRGISASRSMAHMKAWLWLAGVDDVSSLEDDYDNYGKPALRAISEHFGVDWKALDDGSWRNSEIEEGSGQRESDHPIKAALASLGGAL